MRCIVLDFLDFWDFFQFLPHWMLSLSHVMVSSLCTLACSNNAQPKKSDYETFTMVSVPADNIHLDNAVSATQGLFLRDLPAHVCVGPMPPGALLATDLPLNDLNVSWLPEYQALPRPLPGHSEEHYQCSKSSSDLQRPGLGRITRSHEAQDSPHLPGCQPVLPAAAR